MENKKSTKKNLWLKIRERLQYATNNTKSLDQNFDPDQQMIIGGGSVDYYGFGAETMDGGYFIRTFVLDARKKKKFTAISKERGKRIMICWNNNNVGELEKMIDKGYLVEEEKFGIPVVSPSYKSLIQMYGCEKNQELVRAPFGYEARDKPSLKE